MNDQINLKTILVTGVTGYVGGRLVPRLLQAGYQVRVLVRGSAKRLDGRAWNEQVEIVLGDVLAPETLAAAMQDIDANHPMIRKAGKRDCCRYTWIMICRYTVVPQCNQVVVIWQRERVTDSIGYRANYLYW